MILRKFFAQLIVLPVLASPLVTLAAPAYTVAFAPAGFTTNTDWGDIPTKLNDRGQVVGNVDGVPVIWQGAKVTRIAALAGHEAHGINNRGEIVGASPNGPFVYTRAGIRYIPIEDRWDYSRAIAINAAGHVIGYSNMEGRGVGESFLNTGRGAQKIGALGGSWSYVTSMNNAGHVVGYAETASGPGSPGHAFLYKNGVVHDLGAFSGGDYSSGADINDAGQIVGSSYMERESEDGEMEWGTHAFLYERGVMKDLGTLGGMFSYAEAINNAGVIVGGSWRGEKAETVAFVYTRGKMTDLNTRVTLPQGWKLKMATDINDKGQILTRACKFEDCSYWARLTPKRVAQSSSAAGERELNESDGSTE